MAPAVLGGRWQAPRPEPWRGEGGPGQLLDKNALADLKTHGSRFGDRAQAGGLRVALGDLGFPGGRGLKAGGSWEGGSSSSG